MGVKLLRPRVGLVKPRIATSVPLAPADAPGQRRGRGRGGRPWRRIRERILERDSRLCQPCHRLGRLQLAEEVDHIIPQFEGGTDAENNLEAICGPCHEVKSAEESARARRRK